MKGKAIEKNLYHLPIWPQLQTLVIQTASYSFRQSIKQLNNSGTEMAVCVNKVLLGHSHIHSFTCYLQLL